MTESDTKWPTFPAPLRNIFEALWQEVANLHAQWELYIDLFGDPEKIPILNDTVPAVFQLIEENLRANLSVSIGRITDPPQTGRNDNLSLSRLVQSLSNHGDDSFVTGINYQLDAIMDGAKSMRTHRNKRFAHNDLATSINYHKNPLPGISQPQITELLRLIANLMNSIQMNFENGTTSYDRGIQRGNGKDLIFLLEQAVEYDQMKRKSELAKYGLGK
jgi:hypothetical protein